MQLKQRNNNIMFNCKYTFLFFLLYYSVFNILLTEHVFANEGEDFIKAWEYLSKDQFDDAEKINFKKVVKVAKLTTDIALRISNLDHKLTRDMVSISEK